MQRLLRIILGICLLGAVSHIDLFASDEFTYLLKADIDKVTIANGACTIQNGQDNITPGAPQVGCQIIRVILPQGTKLDSISIETSDPVILANGQRLDFARGDIRLDVQPSAHATEPDPSIYSSDEPYPSERAKILYSGYWGNIHLADIAVYPLAYRAKSGRVDLYDEIKLIFKLSELPAETSSQLKSEPLAYGALSQSVVNRDDLFPYAPSNGDNTHQELISSLPQPEYLLITSSDLAEGFRPFVEWKNQKGLASQIALIEDILASSPGIDPPEKIRNYLIGAHANGVRWVLLGGDEDVIPIRYLFGGNAPDSVIPPLNMQQIGDIYYSDLTGNWDADSDGVWGETIHDQPDIYPELYVGRVPVRSASEAAIWSEKAITYEKNPGDGDPSYLNKALIICADEMRDLGQYHQLERWLLNNFTVDATRLIEQPSGSSLSPTQPTGQQVIDVMQEGWGFITNQNHGDFSYYAALSSGFNEAGRSGVWGDTILFEQDAGYNYLTNVNQPGIHYSASCDVAAIDFDKGVFFPGPYYTTYTLAESYLSQPGGGAAFLGYGRWGWVAGSLTLEDKFIRRMLIDSTCNLGIAEALSKIDYPTYSDIIYGHNLFGDPETPFWISVDGALAINGPDEVLEKQNQTMLFHVFADSIPIGNAKVCLYKRDEIFMVAYSNDQGDVSFEVMPESAGVMTVTAIFPGYIPAQNVIAIQSFSGVDDNTAIPKIAELKQNYPNPFNSSTTIGFSLPADGAASLAIYDIGGRLVQSFSDYFNAGSNRIIWDGKNYNGYDIASGIYFYRFRSGEYTSIKQMMIIH